MRLLCLLLLLSCHSAPVTKQIYFENPGNQASPQISVEVADNPGQRAQGLMYRKSMAEDRGMLFVFEDEAERSFWMKNTYLELDIIFINNAFEVVNVVERATPHSESARRGAGPARYVVEIGGGLAKKWGIAPGSKAVGIL